MRTNSIFCFFCMVLFAASCAPAYIPNVANTPLLTGKNDLNLAIYTGTAGFDAQGSFAINDNIGFMVNGSWADRTNDSTENYHKHAFFEAAPGYFTRFGNSGVVEIYGGYGYGWVDSYYDVGFFTNYADAIMNRFFIQPGVGVVTDIFDGSFSSRVVMITISQDQVSETGYFLEPVLTGKLGYKYVKFVAQLGLSVPFNSEKITFEYQPFMISLGMQINLGTIIKHANPKELP
jgi:hypothetical protein